MNNQTGFRKYKKGFDRKWLEDKEMMKLSRELAFFYENLSKNLSFNVDQSEEVMIRFLPKVAHQEILRTRTIPNLIFLRNYDHQILRDQGFDLASFNQKFGNPKCVVAIPLQSLSQWLNTYSWIKLFVSKTLESGLIFTVPKVGVILRKHKAYEKSFKLCASKAPQEEVYYQHKKYFESTETYNDKFFKDQNCMPEAWIPYAVNLRRFIIVEK
ncbi:hypothetical protein K9K85_02485 [Patescibacteria group bacterium]|nr:hypothetical protein [Patescibacteria group bacterium]